MLTISVLLVEDDPVAAGLIRAQLSTAVSARFRIELVRSLERALARLAESTFDVAVVDLMLPDSRGLKTLDALTDHAPQVPFVVLTGLDDDTAAAQAVERGAQDYLVKGETSGRLISRSIRYAIERHRATETLRSLSLLDELTGLYNRRGFTTLARQQLKVAERLGRGVALFFCAVDDFKSINDDYGHSEGDRALSCVADALRATFRGSDLIARVGGDEFVVLAVQPSQRGLEAGRQRLESQIEQESQLQDLACPISVSIGVEWAEGGTSLELDEIVSRADQALRDKKRHRQSR